MLFASGTNNSDAGRNVTVLGVSCVCVRVRVFSFSIIESRHNAKDLCVKRRAFCFKSNERVKQSSNPIRQLIFVRAKHILLIVEAHKLQAFPGGYKTIFFMSNVVAKTLANLLNATTKMAPVGKRH